MKKTEIVIEAKKVVRFQIMYPLQDVVMNDKLIQSGAAIKENINPRKKTNEAFNVSKFERLDVSIWSTLRILGVHFSGKQPMIDAAPSGRMIPIVIAFKR